MIDLHTHTDASDGDLSPETLVELAIGTGLTAMAITDHDTLAGLDAAEKRASGTELRLIRGVETEVDFKPGEFHILGLGLDRSKEAPLTEFLEEIRRRRVSRNVDMIEAIQADGISLSMADLEEMAGGEVIGRLHFARWFINNNLAKDVPDVFSRLLGPGCPYFVPKHRPSLEEALAAIHAAGGKALIAHPLSLWISWGRLKKNLEEWKELGLDGLEARHSGASKREAKRFEELADEFNMIISGGSDYHGAGRPDRRLGRGPAGIKLDESLLEPFLG